MVAVMKLPRPSQRVMEHGSLTRDKLRMRHAPLAQAAGSDVGTCSSSDRLGEPAAETGLQIYPLQVLRVATCSQCGR